MDENNGHHITNNNNNNNNNNTNNLNSNTTRVLTQTFENATEWIAEFPQNQPSAAVDIRKK